MKPRIVNNVNSVYLQNEVWGENIFGRLYRREKTEERWIQIETKKSENYINRMFIMCQALCWVDYNKQENWIVVHKKENKENRLIGRNSNEIMSLHSGFAKNIWT